MIAVDVMGGDRAPHVVLEGGLAAARKSVPVAFYGPGTMIERWLDAKDPVWRKYAIVVIDAPDAIDMAAEPVSAVRKKTNSSLVRAVASVSAGKSAAVVSAGNSGALMAAAALFIGKQEGIERPAIAGFLPSSQGKVLVLDLGANTDCRPHHLQQFAHMGAHYVTQVTKNTRPRVGVLSNGHEPGKGNVIVKEAHQLLQKDTLNFIGNVEPYDIFAGRVDVVVCDGFVGNVLLKTMESVAEQVHTHATARGEMFPVRGGALLLGVKGVVLVCHGNADAWAIEQALVQAWDMTHRNNYK
jgi:glycerol-3-phosphate acyltransferase PlsX